MPIIEVRSLAPIAGRWQFEAEHARYVSPDEVARVSYGLAVSNIRVRTGTLKAAVSLGRTTEAAGRIAFGYSAATGAYFTAGLGGYKYAYVLDEFRPGVGWSAIRTAGSLENVVPNQEYEIAVSLRGQRVSLSVDGVRVVTGTLPNPLLDDQVGIFAWGDAEIRFRQLHAEVQRQRAFVVMQFGDPYNSVYTDVIKRVAEDNGFDAYRVDEVYGPGIILRDIIRGLAESDVIIAEITPPNPNVFYELGYAHALEKPTILLAERGRQLPFDISGYRCILYDNSIKGKGELETLLTNHLRAILHGED